jgi:hypothetical protein
MPYYATGALGAALDRPEPDLGEAEVADNENIGWCLSALFYKLEIFL